MIKTIIHVPLIGKRDAWRPVEAEWVGGDRYRLVGPQPKDEAWAFPTGAVVVIAKKKLEKELVWVAERLVK